MHTLSVCFKTLFCYCAKGEARRGDPEFQVIPHMPELLRFRWLLVMTISGFLKQILSEAACLRNVIVVRIKNKTILVFQPLFRQAFLLSFFSWHQMIAQ